MVALFLELIRRTEDTLYEHSFILNLVVRSTGNWSFQKCGQKPNQWLVLGVLIVLLTSGGEFAFSKVFAQSML